MVYPIFRRTCVLGSGAKGELMVGRPHLLSACLSQSPSAPPAMALRESGIASQMEIEPTEMGCLWDFNQP